MNLHFFRSSRTSALCKRDIMTQNMVDMVYSGLRKKMMSYKYNKSKCLLTGERMPSIVFRESSRALENTNDMPEVGYIPQADVNGVLLGSSSSIRTCQLLQKSSRVKNTTKASPGKSINSSILVWARKRVMLPRSASYNQKNVIWLSFKTPTELMHPKPFQPPPLPSFPTFSRLLIFKTPCFSPSVLGMLHGFFCSGVDCIWYFGTPIRLNWPPHIVSKYSNISQFYGNIHEICHRSEFFVHCRVGFLSSLLLALCWSCSIRLDWSCNSW